MNVKQYRELIVAPSLRWLGLWSKEAEEIVLGTAVHESGGLQYIKQVGGGPALGFPQMEPRTYLDLWSNFIVYRRDLCDDMEQHFGKDARVSPHLLLTNLELGVAMCRIHYLRSPGNIPQDIPGQAAYWKKYYNTPKGKGTVQEYISNYTRFVP